MIKSGDVLSDILLLESEIEINFVENIVKTEAWFILKVKETREKMFCLKKKTFKPPIQNSVRLIANVSDE